MGNKTTGQVAEELNISEPRLQLLLRTRKITPKPRKGPDGKRVWTPRDVENARAVITRSA